MEWLSLWLKKIVLLVLLAAFLDLVLPNTNLQRYVKMVVGLMILLTILTPVFALFRFSPEELAGRLEQYQQVWQTDSREADWQALNQRLLRNADRQVTEYVEREMETRIREQVASHFGHHVAAVEVHWRTTGAQQPEIRSVEIVLGEPEPAESASGRSPVKPIEPVRVDIGEDREQREAAAVYQPAADPVHRRIAQSVAADWNLEPEQVRVIRTDQERS